ncbi:MAG TPA: elongation factor P [Elusimicrobiota bacterium]|nr:elongation factor P [Elusimicrobiota bacterium]
MIDTADIGNGTVFEHDGAVYQVVWFQHHKPGKGGAMLRVKLRNMRTGATIERTFKSGERFKEVSLTRRPKQFLYAEGDNFTFMDMETYDQITVSRAQLGDSARFLSENMEVQAAYIDEEFLGLDLPASVTLKVTSTVPGVKGDSVSNMVKPATLENGMEIQVPLFVKEGDAIRVDTRTSEYVERL